MFRFLAVFIPMAVVGCSEYDLSNDHGAQDLAPPDILVEPMSIQYGELTDGETEVKHFTVTNVGEGPLTVDGMSIVSGISFSIVTPAEELSMVLDPGMSKDIDVQFRPFQGNANFGQVVVLSDDPDSPEVLVDLMGTGMVPELEITPNEHDFGDAFIPCGERVQLKLKNIGGADLVIEDFDYQSAGALEFTHSLNLPLTLAPEEQAVTFVEFVAATEGADYGQLDVFSNDPRGVVSAQQTGEGAYENTVTDTHNVPVDPPVDILFAVDQSCSMDTEAAVLGQAFTTFINDINNVTNGWHIGVVTHDHGCFNNGWMNDSTPSYHSLFQNAVQDGVQETWSESLLKLSDIALSQAGSSGCNAGFLRPGAMLHLVLVSDEPEQSGTNASTWVSRLQGYASNPALFKVSSIADLGGCGLGPSGYDTAAQLTGGELLNICNANWGNQVGLLASASLSGLNNFGMSDTPDPGTIEVLIDGVPVNGWTYDASSNSIEFSNPNFAGGETVEIVYDTLAECN